MKIGRLIVAIALVAISCKVEPSVKEPKHMQQLLFFCDILGQNWYETNPSYKNTVETFDIVSGIDSIKKEINVVTYRLYKTTRGDKWLANVALKEGDHMALADVSSK